MKNKKYLFFFSGLMIISWLIAGAGEKGILQGLITDDHSRPLDQFRIYIRALTREAQTDKKGRFIFNDVPPGQYDLEVSKPDSPGSQQGRVVIQADRTTNVTITWQEETPDLRESITVTASAGEFPELPQGSTMNFKAVELTALQGNSNDISRALSQSASLTPVSDLSNELLVRGGSPLENGFYIDHIPVPDINHFQRYGGSGGAFGILDISLVKDIQFFTGAFPSLYWDRMSSILDISLRDGRRDRFHARAHFGLGGLGAKLEGPFLNHGSWLFTFSRTFLEWLAKPTGYEVVPRLGSGQLKIIQDLGAKHRLELLEIFGNSTLSLNLDKAVAKDYSGTLDHHSNQNTIGLSWLSRWSEHFSSQNVLSWSLLNLGNSSAQVNQDKKYIVTDEKNIFINFRNLNQIVFSQKIQAEFGLEVRQESLELDNYYGAFINEWQNLIPETFMQGRRSTVKSGMFASFHWIPLPWLFLSLGGCGDYFSYNRHFPVSPRLAAKLTLTGHWSMEMAWGIYYQRLPLFIIFSDQMKSLADPHAQHWLLGFRGTFPAGITLTLDLYDKEYNSMPLNPEEPSWFVVDTGLNFRIFRAYRILVDTGKAWSRGLELTVRKNMQKNIFGDIALSLFRSRYRDLFGEWFDRLNDLQYSFSVLFGYRLSAHWQVCLFWKLCGGQPYTPFDEALCQELNKGMWDLSRINARRFPPYHSLTLRADCDINFHHSNLTLYFSVTNAYNRKNISQYFWSRVDHRVEAYYQLPLIPFMGVEYEF